MEDALIPYKSQRARLEKMYQNIYDAASNAAGKDAALEMENYVDDGLDSELDKKFSDELHCRLINHHIERHMDRLAKLFGWNLDKWIAKHFSGNLQFYTDGLFLSRGELYSSIFNDICKAKAPTD